ncbi:hypothetical protein KF947_21345 [Halomonas sp. FeN2]|uniref:hypothetical protein n=1 Tax=Halomonas sp. FeN2 TaxID=2832500 RepID=UPI001D0A6AA0|nr:hypothetical protein [Halomonas sp. FeN2]UBR49823.1 hypothetical protein KF947_21345 [Halomonas sp. FeN2]
MARNNYQAGIVITGDASGGIRAIQKTGKELNELEQRFQRSASQSKRFGADVTQAGRQLHHIDDGAVAAGRGLDVLRTNVAGIAAAMATAFGAGSIISQAGVIADMDALAKSIGMGTTELQAWDYAAQQVKLSGGAIGDILKDVAERIGEFSAEGTGEAAALFENLNLEIKELRNLSPDQQLLKIGEAISGLGRGEQISYLERLGNDATRLLPLLENNAEGLRALTTEARSLGVAMDQVDIDNAIQADRAMAKLTGTMDGFKNQLAADLGPGLATAVSGLTDFIQEAGGAAAVLDDVQDVAMLTAAVMAGRYAGAFASSALSIGTHTAATVAQTQADVTATTAARAKTAETLRVAVSEQAAAKRAYENARATAAATGNTTLRTKAITQLAAANQRAIGAEAAHTAAVNANSAAMARGTVAAQGMAAASRAGAGALALVGGPLGAAMLAGGAIYYFREELGLVQPEIEASADRVAELTGSLDAMSRAVVQNRIADLTADLQTLKTSFIEVTEVGTAADSGMISGSGVLGIAAGELGRQARAIQSAQDGMVQGIHSPETLAEIKAHEEALANLETQYESLGASAITVPPILRNNDEASKSAAKAAEQQANSLQALQQEIDPLLKDYETYLGRLETLDRALAEGTITEERYGAALRWSAEQYKRSATGAEQYEKELKALVGQYDRQRQKAQQLATDEQAIQRAFDSNAISAQQYARMMAEVEEAQYRLALESEGTFAAMATAFDRSVERMDDAGKDFWRGWLDGTGNAVDQFKGIVLDGVAEVAHALITRPLTVGLTADLQGMLGLGAGNQQSGGGLDFGNTISAGRNLLKAGSSLFGGGASTAAAGYGGALGSATGAYGGWAGSAASGAASAGGGFMGAASAAAPWLAGGMVIDEVLGLGIVDGIVSGISGLFGSDRKSYGQIGSQIGGDDTAGDGVYRYDRNDRSIGWAQDSALGTIGVTKKQKTDDSALIEMVGAFVEIDNTLASVMTAAQLEQTRTALDGWESSRTENIGGIVDERLSAVLDATDSIFEEALSQFEGEALVQGLVGGLQIENVGGEMAAAVAADMNAEFREALGSGSDIQAATQSILSSAQAVQTLGGAVDRLGLQFDATAAGALDAAGNLASLVGGTDSLNSLLSGYYDAFYTEQEKFDNLASDLSGTFADMGRELPTTREGVRELVEGLQLMGSAGQEQLATVLQLNQPLSQYIAAMEEQRQATLDATTAENELAAARAAERVDLLNRTSLYSSGIVGGVDDALDAYNEQMSLASEVARQREQQLRDELNAIQQLGNFLDSLALSDQSILDPAQRLQEAQRQFAELQVRAENGDTEAASQLQGASNAYLAEAANYYGQSSSQYAEIYDDVTSSVRSLEDIFGESVATLGTIESIERQMLREQQRAREMLSSSLSEEVRQSDLLGSIADLIDLLPSSLASAISSIMPEFADNSGGGGGFDEAAYLANKTAQVNATGQGGRTDWTQQQVLDAIIRDYGSIQAHYAAVGRGEGIQPYYDADTAPASVGGSSGGGSGSTVFDQAAYLANKTSQVNANGQGGNSSWTQQQVLDAIIRDYGSVEAHYNAIGKNEGVTPYATGAWSIPGDQLAMIHDREMVVPSREGIADEFRAYAAGDYQRELMGELGNIQRALPMPNMPPMPMQSQTNPQADNNAALLRAFAGMRDDNARLLERVGQLEEQLAAIAGNTWEMVEPTRRTATATEETERNSRLKIRNPA